MNLRKIWLIAKREYLYNFRRRSFVFTAFVLPLIMIIVMSLVFGFFEQNLEDVSGYKRIGIVDKAGIVIDASGTPRVEIPPLFMVVSSDNEAATQLKSKEIDGYFVIPANFLSMAQIDAYNRPELTLNEGVQNRLDDLIRQSLAAQVGDKTLATRMQDPLKELGIYRLGSTQRLESTALIAALIIPMVFGLLIYMSITVTSQFMMSGMVEEKENRMMELLVTSIRPSEMLWGKLLGLGALGLTQLVFWVLTGVAYASTRGTNIGQTLASLQITPGFLALLVMYFLLGYLLFGALMSGLGATVNAEQEGRQLASILSMFGVLPFILMFSYLLNPNGPIPVLLSMIPFTAPVGMILRVSWANVPPSDIALSLIIMVISVLVIIWISGRVFRLGMLSYGKRIGLRDIVRAIRQGRRTLVTRPKEAA